MGEKFGRTETDKSTIYAITGLVLLFTGVGIPFAIGFLILAVYQRRKDMRNEKD